MKSANIYRSIPGDLDAEVLDVIISSPGTRIERIISKGHTSPENGWYDQEENEWVIVLQGSGILTFEDGSTVQLSKGDHINIPAHCRHRVSWTDPGQLTIWLTVFYW